MWEWGHFWTMSPPPRKGIYKRKTHSLMTTERVLSKSAKHISPTTAMSYHHSCQQPVLTDCLLSLRPWTTCHPNTRHTQSQITQANGGRGPSECNKVVGTAGQREKLGREAVHGAGEQNAYFQTNCPPKCQQTHLVTQVVSQNIPAWEQRTALYPWQSDSQRNTHEMGMLPKVRGTGTAGLLWHRLDLGWQH